MPEPHGYFVQGDGSHDSGLTEDTVFAALDGLDEYMEPTLRSFREDSDG